jgi:hypothetical protein
MPDDRDDDQATEPAPEAPATEEPTLGDPDGDGEHDPYKVQPPG